MKRQLVLSFAFSVLAANVFAASSTQPVVAEGGSDRLIESRIAEGGSDAGAPGLRPDYTPDYYAAFVRDPDGNKLEAVHLPEVPFPTR